jgi:AcrR family transcriptional regulator
LINIRAVAGKAPGTVRAAGRRPQGEGDVREALLEAAVRLFSSRGRSVGVREIARAAGTTTAMIAYYFGTKEGLYEAMLERVFVRLFGRVRELASHPPRGADASAVERFVRLYVDTIAAEPWVPRVMIGEVLFGDAKLRRRFVERFARPLSEVAPRLVEAEIETGRLRADLDVRLALVSLIALCAFPFVAQPVFEPVFDLRLDAEGRERLIRHVTRLFLEGARPREARS